VYLFFEVRSSPAAPQPRSPVAKADEPKDTETDSADPTPKPRTISERAGGRGPTGMKINRKSPDATEAPAPTPPPPPADGTIPVKLDALMSEANKAYDRQDFDEAKTIAHKVLRQSPGNPRMLRILVSTACIDHDATEAQKHYNLLTDRSDRDVMKTRCQRDYGVTLVETATKK
jgi:hypothetical protein